MHGLEEVLNVLTIEVDKCICVYILCLIELLTRSPEMEVENVFLNVFTGFCKFGKVRKTEETLTDFSEKSKCFNKKEKKRKKEFYHFVSALFSKHILRIVKV